jgi:hypothetical protein
MKTTMVQYIYNIEMKQSMYYFININLDLIRYKYGMNQKNLNLIVNETKIYNYKQYFVLIVA